MSDRSYQCRVCLANDWKWLSVSWIFCWCAWCQLVFYLGIPLHLGILLHLGIFFSSINLPSARNPLSPGNPSNFLFPLDPHLQRIKKPLVVKPRGQSSGSLNKKRSQKDNDFEESTCRKLFHLLSNDEFLLNNKEFAKEESVGIRYKEAKIGPNLEQIS